MVTTDIFRTLGRPAYTCITLSLFKSCCRNAVAPISSISSVACIYTFTRQAWRKFRFRLPPYYSIYCNHTTQNGTRDQTDILMIHSSTSIHPHPFTRIHSIISMWLSRHMYSPTPSGIVLVITRNNPQVPCTNLPGKPRLQLPNIPMQAFAMQAFDWFRFVQKEPSHSPAHLSVLYRCVTDSHICQTQDHWTNS